MRHRDPRYRPQCGCGAGLFRLPLRSRIARIAIKIQLDFFSTGRRGLSQAPSQRDELAKPPTHFLAEVGGECALAEIDGGALHTAANDGEMQTAPRYTARTEQYPDQDANVRQRKQREQPTKRRDRRSALQNEAAADNQQPDDISNEEVGREFERMEHGLPIYCWS